MTEHNSTNAGEAMNIALQVAPGSAHWTEPTAGQLAAINLHSLVPIDASSVEVRTAYILAANGEAMESLATELPGRAVWLNGHAVGRWFEATPIHRPQGRPRTVRGVFYVYRSPRVADLLKSLDAGDASLELGPPAYEESALEARLRAPVLRR